ncbi:MAG: ATP synthase subunit I [Idiomarina sp.]|nr:ATP synthase subunit I [Idiomarina sp.]
MITGKAHHPVARSSRRLALKTLLTQAVIALCLAAVFGLTMAGPGAKSSIAGAVVALVPSFLFMTFAYRVTSGRYAPNIVRYFFVAETVKWLTLMVLFVIAFRVLSGPWLPFFVTVMVLLHVQWVAPFFLNSKTS